MLVSAGEAGPLLRYVDENDEHFTFGQFHRNGTLSSTERLSQRCNNKGLPQTIWEPYMDDLVSLIPGSIRVHHRARSGRERDQIAMGDSQRNNPPLTALAAHKEEWFSAIDRAIVRIREVMDDR
jgi:hypothetical protein